MEYLLLGPLEVHSAGERLPLGGPRQRALLADLALHAGTVVSMDTLLDDLWTGEPPPTAEAVVQNAVSRLRRVLGRETIETRSPGYVLHADLGAIDARRFERLVRDARPLPPAERSAALRDALALWRGPPFADLAFESFLQDEIARLDELRLTALEDRLEAEIELGRHDAVVPESSGSRASTRRASGSAGCSMLALHRAGRQQEALDAYEVLRRSLDELVGLEPSPETRALQLMILNQDPAIAVGAGASPVGRRGAPAGCPAARRAAARRGARARGGRVGARRRASRPRGGRRAPRRGALARVRRRVDRGVRRRGARTRTTCCAPRARRSSCTRC